MSNKDEEIIFGLFLFFLGLSIIKKPPEPVSPKEFGACQLRRDHKIFLGYYP